jgi:hypothetical protein
MPALATIADNSNTKVTWNDVTRVVRYRASI